MSDNFIIEYFFKPKSYKFLNKEKLNNIPKEVQTYLNNRFLDSNSILETIYRIKFLTENINVNIKPKCPICGNPVSFLFRRTKLYTECCSIMCKKIFDKEKIKKTNNERYGGNAPICSNDIKEKIKKTNNERYGGNAPICSNDIKEKIKKTNNERYGVDHVWNNKLIWKKSRIHTIDKYGAAFNIEKYIKTYINKYNIKSLKYEDNVTLSKLCLSKEYKKHIYDIKKKNHTFNSSKSENESYKFLKEKYPDVIQHYKDKERYPFICDFYIPSLDLFIECNYHWTHGGKPFEGTDDDNKIIEIWKSKHSKYYDNAINCWTIRDVNKRNIAKQHNLNYVEIWNINELKRLN